jgi:hypothetical protein
MLIKELLQEALTPTGPSAADIALSKTSIKAVQKELDTLLPKYEAKEAKTRPEKASKDAMLWRIKLAQEHMEEALSFHDKILPAFNAAKKKLDAAYKNNNLEDYNNALGELKNVISSNKVTVLHNRIIKALARQNGGLKVSIAYQRKLRDTYALMRDVVDMANKEVKYVGKSDEDKAAIAKRSARMKGMWAGVV